MGSVTSPEGLFAAESLVHILNLTLPENSTAVEVGVFRAYNLVSIIDNCSKITKIYGIDRYQPYVDYLENPPHVANQEKIDNVKAAAYKEISLSENKDKITIYEEESLKGAERFEDGSLDFVFLDSYLDRESAEADLKAWYPKLKKGGVFAGHDWEKDNGVDKAVIDFRIKGGIVKPISYYDLVWVWIK